MSEKRVDLNSSAGHCLKRKGRLGEVGESELQNALLKRDDSQIHSRQWLIEFYRAIINHEEGDHREFLKTMQKLTDVTRPEWSDHRFFLARMWSEEFFIARHEASKS